MGFLYWLEGIRVPILNEFMLAITTLGEETAFLVLAMIVFWCVDKKRGYLLMSVGFIGTMANQFMKLWFRVPRPWVLDEKFTILEQAREAASGYSFPSGHTTSAVGTFGSIAASDKRRWVRIVSITLAVKEGLRTPLEVLCGDPLPARAVRYFLIVITAGVLWPMTFRWFSKLGSKLEEKN